MILVTLVPEKYDETAYVLPRFCPSRSQLESPFAATRSNQ